MKRQSSTVHCIALCTGYNENASICWTLFTHFTGFDSPIEALRALAADIVARFWERWSVTQLDPQPPQGESLDPVRFIAFVNHSLRLSWADWANADGSFGGMTHWYPFTTFDHVFGMSRASIVVVGALGAEVLLAAHDPSLLTDQDIEAICRDMTDIAEILGIRHFDCASMAVAGSA